MNKKIIGIFLMMLMIIPAVLPVTSAMNKEINENEKKIVNIYDNDDEPLIHPSPAFLFGRVEAKVQGGIGWNCNAANLRVFNLEFLEYHHYTNSEFIEISRFGLGLFIGKFVFGFFMIM